VAAVDSNLLGYAIARLEGDPSKGRARETNLGNLIADALLARAKELAPLFGTRVDIAIQNGGGMRDSVEPGDFTEGMTFDILPFGNTLVVVEDLTPAELLLTLENAYSRTVRDNDGNSPTYGQIVSDGGGTGRFAQIAGFTVAYDVDRPALVLDVNNNTVTSGSRVRDVRLDDGTSIILEGLPVADAPNVNLAINSFNAAGGDQYFVLPIKHKTGLGLSTRQALAEYVTEIGTIGDAVPYTPGINRRIFQSSDISP
jgi:5'-nucleotidase